MRQKAKAIIHVFPFEYTSILLLLLLMWISLGKYCVCFIPSKIYLCNFFDKSHKWKFWMLSLCSIFKKTRISPFEKRPEYLPNCMHTKLLCNEKVPNISIFKKTRIEKRPQYLHFQRGQDIPNQNICAKFYTSLESFIHLGSAAKDWQKNSCKRDRYKISKYCNNGLVGGNITFLVKSGCKWNYSEQKME